MISKRFCFGCAFALWTMLTTLTAMVSAQAGGANTTGGLVPPEREAEIDPDAPRGGPTPRGARQDHGIGPGGEADAAHSGAQPVDVPPADGDGATFDESADGGDDGIGGLPDRPRTYKYESPLLSFGKSLGFGIWGLNVMTSLVYLVFVYPVQALIGSRTPEPVMLWNLIPIVGPWFAQYSGHVKDSTPWRVVLITDAALQATGLVVGVIGALLSGRRTREPEQVKRFDLQLGVQGGPVGLTVSIHAF